jgi:glycosyltransferase involved in cell wall biosynthesis
MTSIRLSAVIITKNEENNIGRCINSLLLVADEIIVMDSLSTDNTATIARSTGARVIEREWEGFSVSKNKANLEASGDYILSIDADEELSPELISSIQRLKHNATADAYAVNRMTNFCGQWIRHSGWYPEYKTRIFKKGEAEWRGSVHEHLAWNKPITTERLHGDLLHYSFPTFDSYAKKLQTYASLAAQEDFRKGKRYNLFFHGFLKPFFMFIQKYFLKAGFLDGRNGFIIAITSAYERFLRYANFIQMKR